MAETVMIEGRPYLKRNPLGVLGLMMITLGIYFLYWYWKINDELREFEHDESISPTRSLMAMLFGWILIVPPFIAMYNTAKHVRGIEERMGLQAIEPALVIVIMLVFSFGNGMYVQEHLNRIWDSASAGGVQPAAQPPPPLPPPV